MLRQTIGSHTNNLINLNKILKDNIEMILSVSKKPIHLLEKKYCGPIKCEPIKSKGREQDGT